MLNELIDDLKFSSTFSNGGFFPEHVHRKCSLLLWGRPAVLDVLHFLFVFSLFVCLFGGAGGGM